jgi:hypothetical protein
MVPTVRIIPIALDFLWRDDNPFAVFAPAGE